jgi:hypothetical protein
VLSDSDFNVITGTNSGVMMYNQDNIISGAGQLGNGELTIINAGTINADGKHALVIDAGANAVFNSGILEASGSGGLTITSSIENSGLLLANQATLTVMGQVSGNGSATIDGTGTLDFESASTANVVFGLGTGGTLKLGDSFHFHGTISGFNGSDTIDLVDMNYLAASITYLENAASTGGTLMIYDGAQTLGLSLLGTYSSDDFQTAADPAMGTLITYVNHELIV